MRRATTLGAKPEGSRERLAQASSDQNARRGRSSGGGEDERDGRSECGNEVGKHRSPWVVVATEPNQSRAITRLTKRLAELGCERVLIEGGSYQNVLVGALRAAELPVVIINPRRVRQFGKNIGQLAKTDQIDPPVLARYGEQIQPPVRERPAEQHQALRGLWVKARTVDRNAGDGRAPLRACAQGATPQLAGTFRLPAQTD
jgi:transposase